MAGDGTEDRLAFLQALRGWRGRVRRYGLAPSRRAERGTLLRVFVRPG